MSQYCLVFTEVNLFLSRKNYIILLLTVFFFPFNLIDIIDKTFLRLFCYIAEYKILNSIDVSCLYVNFIIILK